MTAPEPASAPVECSPDILEGAREEAHGVERFTRQGLGDIPRGVDITAQDDEAGVVILHSNPAVVFRTSDFAGVLAVQDEGPGDAARAPRIVPAR